ncbi:MAG TPA: hypothetical protein PKB02_00910 [Anaerohalosphaeraceae bacterium]|nr:hypothetical protein [Anaerohalosphaeraceae bacterium]
MKTNYGLFIIFIGCLTIPSVAVQNYDIILLSYPPNGIASGPAGLNDLNQIVGPVGGGMGNVYVWQDGNKSDIPFPVSLEFGTAAYDISNTSHVVGGNWIQQGQLWNGSQLVPLGTLGGSSSMPYALNESDQVAGSSQTVTINETVPFLWQNNTMIPLGTLGGHYGRAYAINNHAVVVGFSQNASGDTRAFIYRNSTMTDLGTLGGSQSNAVAVNDANEVVGWSEIASGYQHAFVWRNGVMTDLGTLGGNQSQAFDINDAGQILGWAETATGYRPLVIWENGIPVRLNSLIAPDSGWELVMVGGLNIDEKPLYRINNNGTILGIGFVNGGSYPFLMLPRQNAFLLHDSNEDGTVNLLDFARMSDEWLK